MQTAPSRANDHGFTLIELMAAMVILLVGLLGLLQAVNVSMEGNVKNALREQATAIGAQQMSVLMAKPYNDTASFTRYTTVTASTGGISKDFRVERYKLQLTGRSASDDSYKIRVNVKWSFKNVTSTHQVLTVVSP